MIVIFFVIGSTKLTNIIIQKYSYLDLFIFIMSGINVILFSLLLIFYLFNSIVIKIDFKNNSIKILTNIFTGYKNIDFKNIEKIIFLSNEIIHLQNYNQKKPVKINTKAIDNKDIFVENIKKINELLTKR